MINLRKLRKEKKLTQEQLANLLNVKRTALCEWENDNNKPHIDIIEQIADYFKVSVDYLLGREQADDGITYPQKYVEITEEEKDMLKNYRELSPQRQLETANIIQAYKLFDKEKNGK